jgi:hypothetical protein
MSCSFAERHAIELFIREEALTSFILEDRDIFISSNNFAKLLLSIINFVDIDVTFSADLNFSFVFIQ